MKKAFLFLLPFIITGCGSNSSKVSEEGHQLELAIHRVKNEIESVRHDVSTQQMEIGIIDAKVIAQNDSIDSLKSQNKASHKLAVDAIEYKIALLEKKIGQLVNSQNTIISDLKKLEAHANTTSEALSQQKRRIIDMEKNIKIFSEAMTELGSLKKDLVLLNEESVPETTYTVRPGDSLEKIARRYNTSIDMLKKMNSLQSDLIRPGQSIAVPL